MELSEADLKMLKWLRRQHENWRTTRLITALGSGVVGVFALFGALTGASLFAVVALVAISTFGLSYSLGCWSGRPEISLLLKLVDHYRTQVNGSG